MDYNQIDVLEPGWGIIWQGGAADSSIDAPPFTDPVLVVCMDQGEDDNSYINHANVEAVLTVWINDDPSACLKDNVLIALAKTIAAWLGDQGNAYLHCAAGVSRASYIDVAVHCVVLGISADAALARIRAARPVANPNPGFLAQLQRIWP